MGAFDRNVPISNNKNQTKNMGSACSSTKEKSGGKNKTSLENKGGRPSEEIHEEDSIIMPQALPVVNAVSPSVQNANKPQLKQEVQVQQPAQQPEINLIEAAPEEVAAPEQQVPDVLAPVEAAPAEEPAAQAEEPVQEPVVQVEEAAPEAQVEAAPEEAAPEAPVEAARVEEVPVVDVAVAEA